MDPARTHGYSDRETSIDQVKARLRAFNAAREWEPFHTPKDLAMCVAAEAGELLEPFLWKTPDEAVDLAAVREELADVIICAVNLAAKLDIDLLAAVDAKIALNATRYPVDKARGRATKHDELT